MPHQFPCNLTPRQMYDYLSADLQDVPVEVHDAIEAADWNCLVVGEGQGPTDWHHTQVAEVVQSTLNVVAASYDLLIWDDGTDDHRTLVLAYRKSELNFTGV